MDLLSEIERPDPADEEKRERRFRLVASVGIIGLSLVGVTTLATGALFTDQDTLPGAITAGTVDIASSGNLNVTLALNGGFAPGDSITRAVTVTNNGSLAQFYDVASSAAAGTPGDTLHTVLAVQAEYTATCTPATTFAAAAVPLDGASLVSAQPLAATANETLCVRISFPDGGSPADKVAANGDGDNVFQGDDADVTLTFTAVQRAGIAS